MSVEEGSRRLAHDKSRIFKSALLTNPYLRWVIEMHLRIFFFLLLKL